MHLREYSFRLKEHPGVKTTLGVLLDDEECKLSEGTKQND